MRNKKNDKNHIVIGALIGGLIGGAALYLLKCKGDKPLVNRIMSALSDIGETFEESCTADTDEAIDDIEESIPQGENVVANALTLIATGINLWNKFKKGH
jgi:hypothetical protein